MNLGRTVSHDKILRVAILIGGKTGFNWLFVVVNTVFVLYDFWFQLNGAFRFREWTLDYVVLGGLGEHKLLKQVHRVSLRCKESFRILHVIEKHMTAVQIWEVCIGLCLTVKGIWLGFESLADLFHGYILKVLLQDWTLFAREVPRVRLAVSENYCVWKAETELSGNRWLFCPESIQKPF